MIIDLNEAPADHREAFLSWFRRIFDQEGTGQTDAFSDLIYLAPVLARQEEILLDHADAWLLKTCLHGWYREAGECLRRILLLAKPSP